ncbi:uncharacterized protein N7479_002310 [Penicillium vulpinum]|uniref:uncharacterized protein n=1 Tax=Penicillium vulpinum TaxID=29845 RepID=UPI002546CFBD|nr:uncharacterized protein N7479_002310 [Penicillium vulpinum]KAJ5972392.1 hypothetical protein N7479_002310 [Penicillium vulpinum]
MYCPDFEAFSDSNSIPNQGAKYRDHFMWPYITQEDLLNTKTLPMLLNTRSRYPPSHFAAVDIEAMRMGVVSWAIVPILLNEYVMILNGPNENTRDHGKLMSWSEHPDAFDCMTKRKQFRPGEGLLVLEAQERFLMFRLKCCTQVLHDIP